MTAHRLGRPRVHLRLTDSTNARARALAQAGVPHGTVVTAREQRAGRGRQGRTWAGQPGRSLLASVVVREYDDLLSLRAGLAVADVAGEGALVKWPNDVLLGGGKLAGVLVEGRPQEGWAVVGIGVNVAVRLTALPEEVRPLAATLGRPAEALEATLQDLLRALERRLAMPRRPVLADLRRLDGLRGREVTWPGGTGVGAGIDDQGRLLVREDDGTMHALDAGEVHLGSGRGNGGRMDPIIVRRHGERWAVQDSPDRAPAAEYDTREAAEMAARRQAGRREIVVRDDADDARLGRGGGSPAARDPQAGH